MRRSILLKGMLVGALAGAAALVMEPVLAGARTAVPRSGGHSARPSAPRSPGAAAAPRPGGSPRQTAVGRATYGYGGYYGHGYPGWPWYGYGYGYGYGWYDPWWSFGFGWGWPYYAWYPPYPVAVPSGAPAVDLGPAVLETDVNPRKASIRVDGEDVGRAKDYNGTWDVLRVAPGWRVVEFSAEGFQTLRVVVDAQSGRRYHVAYDLTPGEGMDPRSMPMPAKTQETAIAPQAAIVGSAEPTSPSTVGTLEKGFLRLAVRPDDAAIYLDGAYFARADEIARLRGAIPLVAGDHRIEVVRPGYAGRTVSVTIQGAVSTDVAVDLDREP